MMVSNPRGSKRGRFARQGRPHTAPADPVPRRARTAPAAGCAWIVRSERPSSIVPGARGATRPPFSTPCHHDPSRQTDKRGERVGLLAERAMSVRPSRARMGDQGGERDRGSVSALFRSGCCRSRPHSSRRAGGRRPHDRSFQTPELRRSPRAGLRLRILNRFLSRSVIRRELSCWSRAFGILAFAPLYPRSATHTKNAGLNASPPASMQCLGHRRCTV